jgi:hypothetical protein
MKEYLALAANAFRINKLLALCLAAGFLIPVSCSNAQRSQHNIAGYHLDRPEKCFMPESLLEISGIAFYRGDPDTVYAIQDEEGKLFKLRWNEKKQIHCKFGKRGDYEDLAIPGDQVIVLKSNGNLYSFPVAEALNEEAEHVQEWKSLLPPGEYEGLFGDGQTGKLYVLCKRCEADDNRRSVSGYIFQTGDSLVPAGEFRLDMPASGAFGGLLKKRLHPSALAKSPVTGEWFILSAANHLLLIAGDRWKIKQVVHLNENEFNQPEGIAFDRNGDLYISNEGGDLSEGNILRFPLHANEIPAAR